MSNDLKSIRKKQLEEAPSTKSLDDTFQHEERSSLVVKIPKQLHRACKQAALDEDRDLREVVIDALESYISKKH